MIISLLSRIYCIYISSPLDSASPTSKSTKSRTISTIVQGLRQNGGSGLMSLILPTWSSLLSTPRFLGWWEEKGIWSRTNSIRGSQLLIPSGLAKRISSSSSPTWICWQQFWHNRQRWIFSTVCLKKYQWPRRMLSGALLITSCLWSVGQTAREDLPGGLPFGTQASRTHLQS